MTDEVHYAVDEGVAWLRSEGADAVKDGFDGAAHRIIQRVSRDDDDRAVVILQHGYVPPVETEHDQPEPHAALSEERERALR